jgi:hypothetical protein
MNDKSSQRNILFHPDEAPQFGREVCFLCGADLAADRSSDEHVIPKWVQERYQLWDQKLTLLNGTRIPYRQLTIPCCLTCNNEHLGRIEAQVQRACDQGAQAVRELPELTLFLWVGKILFGLLYRQHLLPWNRRQKDEGPIVSAEVLQEFRLHHQFLQAARGASEFSPQIPASLFVYQTMEPSERKMGFDYFDFLFGMGISIRVGKVGIVACLQDGGAVKFSFGEGYRSFQKLKLHWIQFAEVTARTFYDLSRFNRTPKFILAESGGMAQAALMPLGGLSGKPLFDDGSIEGYAPFLARFSRFPLGEVYRPEVQQVVGWLYQAGKLTQMLPDDPP